MAVGHTPHPRPRGGLVARRPPRTGHAAEAHLAGLCACVVCVLARGRAGRGGVASCGQHACIHASEPASAQCASCFPHHPLPRCAALGLAPRTARAPALCLGAALPARPVSGRPAAERLAHPSGAAPIYTGLAGCLRRHTSKVRALRAAAAARCFDCAPRAPGRPPCAPSCLHAWVSARARLGAACLSRPPSVSQGLFAGLLNEATRVASGRRRRTAARHRPPATDASPHGKLRYRRVSHPRGSAARRTNRSMRPRAGTYHPPVLVACLTGHPAKQDVAHVAGRGRCALRGEP